LGITKLILFAGDASQNHALQGEVGQTGNFASQPVAASHFLPLPLEGYGVIPASVCGKVAGGIGCASSAFSAVQVEKNNDLGWGYGAENRP